MKYNDLELTQNKAKRRVGRGIAAGRGKTAGRGTKGQKARSGSGRRPGFEGGQNPLMQRLPKLRGFNSHRPKVETVYTGQLGQLKSPVDNFTLAKASYISSPYAKVKLLLKGEVSKKLSVHLQSASESAIAALQKAGGEFIPTTQVKRQTSQKKSEKASKTSV